MKHEMKKPTGTYAATFAIQDTASINRIQFNDQGVKVISLL